MYKKYVGIMVVFALVVTVLPLGSVRADEATTTDTVATSTEVIAAVDATTTDATTVATTTPDAATTTEEVSAPESLVTDFAAAAFVSTPTLKVVTGSCYDAVLPQLPGDVNLDGNVNKTDLDLLKAGGYDISSTTPGFNPDADFNHDGKINFYDLVQVSQNYGSQTINYTALFIVGDANGDGIVNQDDSTILSATYTKSVGQNHFDARADFNSDGIVDFKDLVTIAQHFGQHIPMCAPVTPVTPPATTTPPVTTTTGGSTGGNGGYTGGAGIGGGATLTSNNNGGQVLGASTSAFDGNACPAYIAHYIKFGATNNVNDVVNLQVFLRNNIDSSIKITGTYDQASLAAVNAFQVKYANDVLAPWVPFGLPTATTSTGYVYKTTKWKINSIMCPSDTIAMPLLP